MHLSRSAFLLTIILILVVRDVASDRCRNLDDFGSIPSLQISSPFYNLGFPLIRNLCIDETRKDIESYLSCEIVSKHRYKPKAPKTIKNDNSVIFVDSNIPDALLSKSEGLLMCSVFHQLFKLHYKVRALFWPPNCYYRFPEATNQTAVKDALAWNNFVRTGAIDPFADVQNFIAFRITFTSSNKEFSLTKDMASNRVITWLVENRHSSTNNALSFDNSHCIGASLSLAESSPSADCSTSGVIAPATLSSHRKRAKLSRVALKQNVVLVDNACLSRVDPKDLKARLNALGLKDADVVVFAPTTVRDVSELFKRVKVSVSCSGGGGVDFLSSQAVLYDVVTLAYISPDSRNVFDFPVPGAYALPGDTSMDQLGRVVTGHLTRYPGQLGDLAAMRNLSMHSEFYGSRQLDLTLFSRDVLFRSQCRSGTECRRALCLAMSIWSLFPTARIELLIAMTEREFMRETMDVYRKFPSLLNAAYFKLMRRKDVFMDSPPSCPCPPGRATGGG